jgi:hypothetical protein
MAYASRRYRFHEIIGQDASGIGCLLPAGKAGLVIAGIAIKIFPISDFSVGEARDEAGGRGNQQDIGHVAGRWTAPGEFFVEPSGNDPSREVRIQDDTPAVYAKGDIQMIIDGPAITLDPGRCTRNIPDPFHDVGDRTGGQQCLSQIVLRER